MRREQHGSDDQYSRGERDGDGSWEDWDKNYPDPRDVAELEDFPEHEDKPTLLGGFRIPGLIKAGMAFAVLIFVASIAVPFLATLGGGSGQQGLQPAGPDENRRFRRWVEQEVSTALAGSDMATQARLVDVQFQGSSQSPLIIMLDERDAPEESVSKPALRDSTADILRRVFSDDRASSATVFWVVPLSDAAGDGARAQIILAVGMERHTADQLDLETLNGENLREVADHYQEATLAQNLPTTSTAPSKAPARRS